MLFSIARTLNKNVKIDETIDNMFYCDTNQIN